MTGVMGGQGRQSESPSGTTDACSYTMVTIKAEQQGLGFRSSLESIQWEAYAATRAQWTPCPGCCAFPAHSGEEPAWQVTLALGAGSGVGSRATVGDGHII